MQLRIANEPIPEGRTVQRIKLIDAMKMAREQHNPVSFTQTEFEEGLEFEFEEIKRSSKIHKICRECKKPYIVWRGMKREHARLCQLCEFLKNRKRRKRI